MVDTDRKIKPGAFAGYRTYISRLQALTNVPVHGGPWIDQAVAALDGQASRELQLRASRHLRQKHGTFFTGTTLSARLLRRATLPTQKQFFYDPTCGMGDLLLAAAKRLPLASNLPKTLELWGGKLAGTDLQPEFIDGTKARLILLAQKRLGNNEIYNGSTASLFPQIKIGDGLLESEAYQQATTLLMNPPFGLTPAPMGCAWAGGRVSLAATFMATAVEKIESGTEVLAILPDVLRAGSFSEQWRERIGDLAEVHLIEPYGVFDDSADVDVFILRLVRRDKDSSARLKKWPAQHRTRTASVAACFDVHVGRVVPHRDRKSGTEHPYIHPRAVPAWKVLREFKETRKYKGLVYQPPFLVIRRTSRPGHPYRATATVIAGKMPVAVENHLIVCEPKDKTLKSCQTLMRQLKSEAVNNFLNRRICCRHLTVGAVGAIPYAPVVKQKRRSE